jgi:NAD(P)-dependent dehydrogenase (short-subunit alcohol dehydrogenase family)
LQASSLRLLVNNAAAYGPRGTTLWTITAEDWRLVHATNVIGTALLTRALVPCLSRDGAAMIANISSWQGSLAANNSGRKYAYRTSKAGLNMLTRCLAADLRDRGISCVSIDPGWVRTQMGEPGAEIGPAESARRIRNVLAGLSLDDSGSFLDCQGKVIPW